MLKMFRGRDRRSQGGVSHNDVQIFKHLEEADVDTLVDELAVLTDDAADGNVDLDKINAYLDALDEKDPIPFGVSAEDSLAKFHARHDLLTNELSKSHQKRSKSKRIATKIAASFAVLCIVGSLTAEACGIDLFSTIARWTSEIFQLDQSGTPYAEITKYPLEIGEVKTYASLQEAVDALGVTSPLVPKYLPERYSSDGCLRCHARCFPRERQHRRRGRERGPSCGHRGAACAQRHRHSRHLARTGRVHPHGFARAASAGAGAEPRSAFLLKYLRGFAPRSGSRRHFGIYFYAIGANYGLHKRAICGKLK